METFGLEPANVLQLAEINLRVLGGVVGRRMPSTRDVFVVGADLLARGLAVAQVRRDPVVRHFCG